MVNRMAKIRIILSDPQVLFREGMHFTLSAEEDLEVIGESTDNEEALASIKTELPNIIIINMNGGKLDGATAMRRIKRSFPSVSVILVADRYEEEQLFTAIKFGACAYLTKNISPEYLLDLVRVTAQGGQPIIGSLLIPALASRVLEEFKVFSGLGQQLGNILALLLPRETEILENIASGMDIKQISLTMNINEEIIRKYLRAIVNKLIADNQARAVVEAMEAALPPAFPAEVAEYVTREEFEKFKGDVWHRLGSLTKENMTSGP